MLLGEIGNFRVINGGLLPSKTPTNSKTYYYIELENSNLQPGQIINLGSDKQTPLTHGFSNKSSVLFLIDKYRPKFLPKFEDLIHLYVTLDEPESWHGELGQIYTALPVGPTLTVDTRWLMLLETWHALLKPENFEYHFKQKLEGKWLRFVYDRIQQIVDNFWACNVFDVDNYSLSADELAISLRTVDLGPLTPKYQMVLARKIQILSNTGRSGDQWL